MTFEDKINNILKLHFNNNQKKIDEWYVKPNVFFSRYNYHNKVYSPKELIDDGKAEHVFNLLQMIVR